MLGKYRKSLKSRLQAIWLVSTSKTYFVSTDNFFIHSGLTVGVANGLIRVLNDEIDGAVEPERLLHEAKELIND